MAVTQEKLNASRKLAADVANFMNHHELHGTVSIQDVIMSLYLNLLLTVRDISMKEKPEIAKKEIDLIILKSIENFALEAISTYVLNTSLDDKAKTETGLQ